MVERIVRDWLAPTSFYFGSKMV